VQAFVVNNPGLPMFCMGDLNNIMNANENLGPRPAHARRISEFCCMIKNCGLFDLGYNRPAYTWSNKCFNSNPTYERLDHCLGNAEWCTMFPTTTVYHLPMVRSDHALILVVLDTNRNKTKKKFRFENWWLLEQDFQQVAKESWQKSHSCTFHQKTKFLATNLKIWRKTKPKLTDQLETIEQQSLLNFGTIAYRVISLTNTTSF
jgi:hypothetical protein